jgi:polyphenol oxidase
MPSRSQRPSPSRRNHPIAGDSSNPTEPGQISSNIEEVDELFKMAGLHRSRREKPAGVARRAAFQDKNPEELRPEPPRTITAPNGVEWIPVPAWRKIPRLWHGFSTRRGGLSTCYALEDAPGELNLGFTPDDDRENVLRNRRLLAEAITGTADTPLVMVRQIHSSILVLARPESGQAPCKGDGLITDRPGVLLGVQTADCTPVLVADRKRKVVAAFHAGWRGTVKRIVENGIGAMRLQFGSKPEDLIAAIGPGIGPCCYQIGEELLSEFESQFAYARELFHEVYDSDPVRKRYPMLFLTQRAPGHSPIGPGLHLDVAEANRRQLLDAGLKRNAIQMIGGCTSCHRDLFFSHRGSQGRCGRMLSVIGIAG